MALRVSHLVLMVITGMESREGNRTLLSESTLKILRYKHRGRALSFFFFLIYICLFLLFIYFGLFCMFGETIFV